MGKACTSRRRLVLGSSQLRRQGSCPIDNVYGVLCVPGPTVRRRGTSCRRRTCGPYGIRARASRNASLSSCSASRGREVWLAAVTIRRRSDRLFGVVCFAYTLPNPSL